MHISHGNVPKQNGIGTKLEEHNVSLLCILRALWLCVEHFSAMTQADNLQVSESVSNFDSTTMVSRAHRVAGLMLVFSLDTLVNRVLVRGRGLTNKLDDSHHSMR